MGAVHFLWLGACRSASPPFEEVGYAHVFEAASAGEQGVGIDFRPVAPGSFEPVPDDAIAGAFAMPDPTGRPIYGRRREAVFAAFADAPENPGACLPDPSGRGSSAGRSSGARRPGVRTESHRRASSGGSRDGIRSFLSDDCHIVDRPGFRFGTDRRALRRHDARTPPRGLHKFVIIEKILDFI